MGIKAYPILIKGSFDPIGIIKLWNAVKKENIDILYAHQGKVFWPCIFVKWLRKAKTKDNISQACRHTSQMDSKKPLQMGGNKVIAISEAVGII